MTNDELQKMDSPMPSGSETDVSPACQRYYAASKRIPIDVKRYCGMCRQHGLQLRTRGHVCAYKDCACEKCTLVRSRRGVMSEQIRLRRAQDKRFQRTNKPSEADLIPINAAQLALSKGGRATRSSGTGNSGPCYFCQKCKNHGIIAHKKQHKAECEFADCTCPQCALIATRRSIDQDIKTPRMAAKRTPCLASPSGSVESAASAGSADSADALVVATTNTTTDLDQMSINEHGSASKRRYLVEAMDNSSLMPSTLSPSYSIASTCSPSTSAIMPLQMHDNTPSPTWGVPSPLDSVHSNDLSMFGCEKIGANNNNTANLFPSSAICTSASLPLGKSSRNELTVSNMLLKNLMVDAAAVSSASVSSAFAPVATLPHVATTNIDVPLELQQLPLFSQLAAFPPMSSVFSSLTTTSAAAAAAVSANPELFASSSTLLNDNASAFTRKSSVDMQLLNEFLYIQQQRQRLVQLQKQQQQQQLLNEQQEEQLKQLSKQIRLEQQALAYIKEQQQKQGEDNKINDTHQQQLQIIVAIAQQHALAAAAATMATSTVRE